MEEPSKRPGVSVRDIENFAKHHRFEVFFCITFILAGFFSFFMWGTGLAVIAITVGAIVGSVFPAKVGLFTKKTAQFVLKQENTTQIVLAVVAFILAIFLPPLVFLFMGLRAGKDFRLSVG